jgi:hypothetical protein
VTVFGAKPDGEVLESYLKAGVRRALFGVSQMVVVCEMCRRAAAKGGKRPVFYVTHITGIFDEHLKE